MSLEADCLQRVNGRSHEGKDEEEEEERIVVHNPSRNCSFSGDRSVCWSCVSVGGPLLAPTRVIKCSRAAREHRGSNPNAYVVVPLTFIYWEWRSTRWRLWPSGPYDFRHASLLPLFRCRSDHWVPCVHVAGRGGVWGSVQSIGTRGLIGIVVPFTCRLCQSFQTVCRRKTCVARVPGDLVFLRSSDREIHPDKSRQTEFCVPRFGRVYLARTPEVADHNDVLS